MPRTPCCSAHQSIPSTLGLSQQGPTNVKDSIWVQTPIHTHSSGKETKLAGKIILVIYCPEDY